MPPTHAQVHRSKATHFLNLPPEIRIHGIYQYLLPSPGDIRPILPWKGKNPEPQFPHCWKWTALLCVNKELHDEVANLVYSNMEMCLLLTADSSLYQFLCEDINIAVARLRSYWTRGMERAPLFPMSMEQLDYQCDLMVLEEQNRRRLLDSQLQQQQEQVWLNHHVRSLGSPLAAPVSTALPSAFAMVSQMQEPRICGNMLRHAVQQQYRTPQEYPATQNYSTPQMSTHLQYPQLVHPPMVPSGPPTLIPPTDVAPSPRPPAPAFNPPPLSVVIPPPQFYRPTLVQQAPRPVPQLHPPAHAAQAAPAVPPPASAPAYSRDELLSRKAAAWVAKNAEHRRREAEKQGFAVTAFGRAARDAFMREACLAAPRRRARALQFALVAPERRGCRVPAPPDELWEWPLAPPYRRFVRTLRVVCDGAAPDRSHVLPRPARDPAVAEEAAVRMEFALEGVFERLRNTGLHCDVVVEMVFVGDDRVLAWNAARKFLRPFERCNGLPTPKLSRMTWINQAASKTEELVTDGDMNESLNDPASLKFAEYLQDWKNKVAREHVSPQLPIAITASNLIAEFTSNLTDFSCRRVVEKQHGNISPSLRRWILDAKEAAHRRDLEQLKRVWSEMMEKIESSM